MSDKLAGWRIEQISSQITTYRSLTSRITALHSRSLERTSDEAIQQDNAELQAVTNQAGDLQGQIQRSIRALHARAQNGSLPISTIQHANRVQEKFKAAIQDFQIAEREYRQRYAQRIERQFKIVKPDATPEEVRAVVEDPTAGTQIFTRAVASSDRYGEARAAYRQVEDRHAEIQRIEASITELGQLFNEMAILIDEQQNKVDHIQDEAKKADDELERGVKHAEDATEKARSARRKRIWCFWIIVLIIIAIVCAIAIPLALKNN